MTHHTTTTIDPDSDTLTDWRGNTYTIGDRVLYPRTSGRSCEIQEGRITKINRRDDGEIKSIGIMPFRSSRFGYGPSAAVSITIISNITRVMEPESVITLPTFDESNIGSHIKDDHGDKINHLYKVMEARTGNKNWYWHRATNEEKATWHGLLMEFHAGLHTEELNGIAHVHDHNVLSHEWEERVERYDPRRRMIAWQHKTTGERQTRPEGSPYAWEHTSPDLQPYNRRHVSEWERVYEDYLEPRYALYCSHCDVKMVPNDHRNVKSPQGMICQENIPQESDSA